MARVRVHRGGGWDVEVVQRTLGVVPHVVPSVTAPVITIDGIVEDDASAWLREVDGLERLGDQSSIGPVNGLDVLEHVPVRVAGDQALTVRSGHRPVQELPPPACTSDTTSWTSRTMIVAERNGTAPSALAKRRNGPTQASRTPPKANARTSSEPDNLLYNGRAASMLDTGTRDKTATTFD